MVSPNPSPVTSPGVERRTRQKRLLNILGPILIGSGLVVLIFLDRIPWPMRVAIGFGDLVAGAIILLVVRQKYQK